MSEIELIGSRDAAGMNFGRRLCITNTVSPCPVCGSSGRLHVYETAVQWSCGCARVLPAMSTPKKPYAPGGHSTALRRAAA